MSDATSLNLNASPLAMLLGAGSMGVASNSNAGLNVGLPAGDPAQAEAGPLSGFQGDFQAMLAAQTGQNLSPVTTPAATPITTPAASALAPSPALAPQAAPLASEASTPQPATLQALRPVSTPISTPQPVDGTLSDTPASGPAVPTPAPVVATMTVLERNGNLPVGGKFLPVGLAADFATDGAEETAQDTPPAAAALVMPEAAKAGAAKAMAPTPRPRKPAGDETASPALEETAGEDKPVDEEAAGSSAPLASTAPTTSDAPATGTTNNTDTTASAPDAITQETTASQSGLPGTMMAMNLATPLPQAAPTARPVATAKAAPLARDGGMAAQNIQPSSRTAPQTAALQNLGQSSDPVSLPADGQKSGQTPPSSTATSTVALAANFAPAAPTPSGLTSVQTAPQASAPAAMAPGTAAAASSPEATGNPSGNKVINADPATAVSGIAQSTIAPDAAVQGVITQGTILPSGLTLSPGTPQVAQTEKPVSTVSLAVSAQAAQWPLMAAMPEAAKAPAAEGVTAPSIGGAKATPFGAVKAPGRTALAASDGTDQTATAPARSAVSADLGTATLASASPAETTTPQLRDTLSFAADPLSSVANSAAPRVDMGAGYETSRDMSALVDRLVETRAAMRSSAPSQWVSTSIQHAEFGRVSLQIRQDGSDLSVAMTSQDPSFAPAAQAALHSAQSLLQPAAASQSSADNTQDNHQSSQQGQQAQANGNGSSFGNPSSGGQSGSPSGGQERQTPWRQQAPFALDNPSAATQAPAKDETSGAKPSGRSGLLA